MDASISSKVWTLIYNECTSCEEDPHLKKSEFEKKCCEWIQFLWSDDDSYSLNNNFLLRSMLFECRMPSEILAFMNANEKSSKFEAFRQVCSDTLSPSVRYVLDNSNISKSNLWHVEK